MRKFAFLMLLLVLLVGCARHIVGETRGIERQRSDNPEVMVTSDISTLRQVPRGFEPDIEWCLNPPLGQSFEIALEKYIDRAKIRIIDAEIAPNTLLLSQSVRTSMLVEVNGRTYSLQHQWETDNAGWGGKWVDLIPQFIDKLAQQLSEKLRAE